MFKKFAYCYSILYFLSFIVPSKTSAQILPDDTLGTENSQINSIDEFRSRIEGYTNKRKNHDQSNDS